MTHEIINNVQSKELNKKSTKRMIRLVLWCIIISVHSIIIQFTSFSYTMHIHLQFT